MEDHQSLQLQGTLIASQLAANTIRLKLEELVQQDDRVLNPASAYARWSVIGNFVLNPEGKHGETRVYALWQVAELLCDLLKKEISAEEKPSVRTRSASPSKHGQKTTAPLLINVVKP